MNGAISRRKGLKDWKIRLTSFMDDPKKERVIRFSPHIITGDKGVMCSDLFIDRVVRVVSHKAVKECLTATDCQTLLKL